MQKDGECAEVQAPSCFRITCTSCSSKTATCASSRPTSTRSARAARKRFPLVVYLKTCNSVTTCNSTEAWVPILMIFGLSRCQILEARFQCVCVFVTVFDFCSVSCCVSSAHASTASCTKTSSHTNHVFCANRVAVSASFKTPSRSQPQSTQDVRPAHTDWSLPR